MNNLGELMEAGIGIPQDYAGARGWYEKAAALGDADAMGNLGKLLETGQGGQQNVEKAKEWYLKGSALNGRVAMHRLGVLFENGRWTSKDLSQARSWYERAAALRYAPALNDLGRMHLDGLGTTKNFVLAKNSFERAAELGNAEAMNNLGVLYFNGTGAQRDVRVAASWFERATALRNSDAVQNLRIINESIHLGGNEIGARRASCSQSCTTVHQSYMKAACARPATASANSTEREKCISASLLLAKACRDSCGAWALLSQAENKCVACFRTFVSCATTSNGSESCHAAFEHCTGTCAVLKISASGGAVSR
jgi:TPR repeat protein